VLFTRGADRATQLIDWVENVIGSIWAGADALWRSFQTRVKGLHKRQLRLGRHRETGVQPVVVGDELRALACALSPPEELSTRAEGIPR
jgi:hypothetical protein